jgi:hypothetical protein
MPALAPIANRRVSHSLQNLTTYGVTLWLQPVAQRADLARLMKLGSLA